MFIQLQDASVFGSEGTTVGYAAGASNTGAENSMLDLHQGYFDLRKLFDMPLTVRVGRQEIVWGDHRVLGNFVWSNVGRVFDAGRFMWDTDTIHAEVIAAKVDEDGFLLNGQTSGTAGGSGGSDENMYAAQLAFKKLIPSALLELMYINKSDQDDSAANSTLAATGNTAAAGDPINILTLVLGLTVKCRILDAIDYSLESHVQVGNYGRAKSGGMGVCW